MFLAICILDKPFRKSVKVVHANPLAFLSQEIKPRIPILPYSWLTPQLVLNHRMTGLVHKDYPRKTDGKAVGSAGRTVRPVFVYPGRKPAKKAPSLVNRRVILPLSQKVRDEGSVVKCDDNSPVTDFSPASSSRKTA